jgi:hypothetical protein
LGGFNRTGSDNPASWRYLLPAIGLIYVNFSQLRTFDRDKLIEKAIHRDFQEMLAISEKRINKEMYAKRMT